MPPKTQKAVVEQKEEQKADLIAYYKTRVEQFEAERADLIQVVDKCAVQASELHRLDWENRKRADEVRELQKALSDAHAFLFEERQRLLTLQAENDELRLQEIEDRKRIQQLLGQQPQGARGAPNNSLAHYGVDALLLKVESLQAQLNEQKQLAQERIAALLEDRRIREAEEATHRAHMSSQLDILAEKLRGVEEQLRTTTRDYILARRDKAGAEERAVAAEAALESERAQASSELASARRRSEREAKEARAAAEARLEDVAGTLRKQLKAKEGEVASLASVHTATKAQYEARVAELEARCTKLAATNRQLEGRRARDMEGWTADVTHLRKLLTAVDRKLHEMRLTDRLGDDDRLDAIIANLRKKAPLPPPLAPSEHGRAGRDGAGDDTDADTHDASDAGSLSGVLVGGLREMRGRIQGLEGRLASHRVAVMKEGHPKP